MCGHAQLFTEVLEIKTEEFLGPPQALRFAEEMFLTTEQSLQPSTLLWSHTSCVNLGLYLALYNRESCLLLGWLQVHNVRVDRGTMPGTGDAAVQ